MLKRQSSGWQSGQEAFGQPPPSFPSCSDSEQTGWKGCRQFTYIGDQVSLLFFYNGHNSESEGGCENDNGNGCEGSDGGDVFFYRGVDVAL